MAFGFFFLGHVAGPRIGGVWHKIGVVGDSLLGRYVKVLGRFTDEWNEGSFSERSFICSSALLIPATNRSRRALRELAL